MSVVDCKAKYIRPKFNNLKECIEDEISVYIGRRRHMAFSNNIKRYPPHDSHLSNPFEKGRNREQVINRFLSKLYI